MHDAIVIGAGIGGLSAAICLAAAGKRVRVLESASEPGGKAGIEIIDGVEVDTGPTLLTMAHVFDEILGLAGMRLSDQAPLRHAEPFFRYLWPDGTALDFERSYGATRANVARALGETTAGELDAFLRYASEIWDIARPRFVLGDAPTLGDLLKLGLSGLREASKLDAWGTMWGAIKTRVASPYLRDVLARYATYNGSDPRRAPATLNCIAHVELREGASSVAGGTYELVRALRRAADKLGVRFDFGREVRTIRVAGSRTVGVELAGGECVDAPIVIANADVAQVASHLLPPGKRSGVSPGGYPSASGYCAIVKARRIERRPAHTVLFSRRYIEEFVDLFDSQRPPVTPTVYVCAQEPANGRAGWAEHEPLFVMVNAPAEPHIGETPAARFHELETRTLARLVGAGIIGQHDEVVWRRSPADLARRFPGSRGAIYGAASHSWNAAFKRPPNVVSGLRGLYLASGSAHPGGGLPLAALSGRAAARCALRQTTWSMEDE